MKLFTIERLALYTGELRDWLTIEYMNIFPHSPNPGLLLQVFRHHDPLIFDLKRRRVFRPVVVDHPKQDQGGQS
jgi:hypothetical protein